MVGIGLRHDESTANTDVHWMRWLVGGGARLVVVVVIVVVRISISRSISIRVRIRIGTSSRSTRIVVIVVVVVEVVVEAVAVVVVCMPALHRSVCHESVGQMFHPAVQMTATLY